MDKIFKELLSVNEVRGVLLVSDDGAIRYRHVDAAGAVDPDSVDWLSILNALAGVREAEFLCAQLRLYIRRTESSCLVVLMGPEASPAMVRLSCDLLLPALKEHESAKGLRRFFKR